MDRPQKNLVIRFALPAMILLSMLVIYFPLPTWLMDFLLVANLAVSVLMLLAAVFVRTPLELKVFPSLLLVTTLSRLSLNVATTRLILGNGATDRELAAGEIVNGFSQFVAGDSIVVGSIIFLILFLVQFLVITKGATRIGEVAARFALDSMPGRQMAIDADLQNGAINFEEAQRRRRELVQYADFQGSMDGASKYIRGDAVAGLAITGINIVGGMVQGLAAGMSIQEAANVFTRLTIGDGLISQLPALLISLAAGLLITRGTEDSDLPSDSITQLISSPIAMYCSAAFLMFLPLASLPAIPLWTIGGGLIVGGMLVSKSNREQAKTLSREIKSAAREPKIERLLETDQIELQVGSNLLSLCNSQAGGTVVADISALRAEIAADLGIVLPKVRIRDNLQITANRFRISIDGNVVFEGTIERDKSLFLHTRDTFPIGETKANFVWAPYAVWAVSESEQNQSATAQISATKVIVHSLRWLAYEHADQLLTRDATNELIEETRKSFPRLVADTVPEIITIGQLQKTFRHLLREGIALRPMHLILETINENKGENGDIQRLTRLIRESMQRHTAQRLAGPDGRVTCFGISDELTDSLEDAVLNPKDENTVSGKFNAGIRRNLRAAVQSGAQHLLGLGFRPIMLVNSSIVEVVKNTILEIHPRVVVLSEEEIPNPGVLNMIAEITPGGVGNASTNSAAA
jgi:flagellar biosynthesis protein FlhA